MSSGDEKFICLCQRCSSPIEAPRSQSDQMVKCPECGTTTIVHPDNIRPAQPESTELPQGAMYCVTCGTLCEPQTRTKGSFGMEVFLWLIFLLPGLIYSVWRLTTRANVCPSCGSKEIIPAGSPRAQQLMKLYR